MSVVRIKKRENPYVQIDKRCLEDARLSWRAKGVLAYLLSKPDGWKVSVKDIWNNGKEGRNAVQDCLAELAKIGYAELITLHKPDGSFSGSEWVIIEEPKTGFSDTPTDKPEMGKPTNRQSGSRLYNNNDINSNNEEEREGGAPALKIEIFEPPKTEIIQLEAEKEKAPPIAPPPPRRTSPQASMPLPTAWG